MEYEQPTFNDHLYEWMSRAPWLLISGAMHLVIALILAAIPWSHFDRPKDDVVTSGIEVLEEVLTPDPPKEVIETIPEETEPILEPIESFDVQTADAPVEFDSPDTTPSETNTPFEDSSRTNDLLGIGPGGGGSFGGRFGDKSRGRGDGRGTHVHVEKGLRWLAAHQDADGSWDCDDFAKHDPANDRTDGAGDPNHDVGVTGLAVLAFLGDGHTLHRGEYRDVVKRGVRWLIEQQDRETGLVGEALGHSYVYDHAIATVALAEATALSRSVTISLRAQAAVDFISRFRRPYGVWRYQPPPHGGQDTSVTGWMIFAMKAAEDAGLRVDRQAYVAAEQWFDEMTDGGTGRVGYVETGSPSSRVPGINDHFPTDRTEALTAVTLLCRFFLGGDPDERSVMRQHADLIARSLPEWDPEGGACDMVYWYYGSYAMFQMGGHHWKRWNRAMKSAVVDSQRRGGAAEGSWDPVGPWGSSGGRVYSTATMVLCLEVYYRYSRVLGSR